MNLDTSLYLYVLEKVKGLPLSQLKPISDATGVPAKTIEKIAREEIAEPGVHKIEKLAAYFRGFELKAGN